MNAQQLAEEWDIDNETMIDYTIAITGRDDINRLELSAVEVSEILKLYFEDQLID